MPERDVVVVGAGPAGSALAIRLADAGHDVLLVDGARFPRPKPCAEYASPGAVEVLDRLGALGRLSRRAGRRLRGMQLHAPSGRHHLVEYRRADGPRHGLAVERTDLDATLVEVARGRGATVWEGFRATALLRDDGVVRGILGGERPGAEVAVRARLVVGADGLHSLVARSLGLCRRVRWPRRLGLVAHLSGVAWPEDVGQMRVGRHGYVGVAPVARDVLSVGVVVPLPSPGRADRTLERALGEFPDLAARLAPGEPVGRVRGVGPLAQAVGACAGPGFLLVGDAAGFLDPFTGEGIYRALRGAEVAAEAAAPALRDGREPVDVGAAYARARARTFGPKERLTLLIQAFVHAPALMDYAVDRLTRRPAQAQLLANVLGDLEAAESALQPSYLWRLLRP